MMYFYQELHPYGFLIFKADAPHVHLVQSDDGVYGLGEADFFHRQIMDTRPYPNFFGRRNGKTIY